MRDLWWQGIPPSVRGKVWSLAIGNELNITHGECSRDRRLRGPPRGPRGVGRKKGKRRRAAVTPERPDDRPPGVGGPLEGLGPLPEPHLPGGSERSLAFSRTPAGSLSGKGRGAAAPVGGMSRSWLQWAVW